MPRATPRPRAAIYTRLSRNRDGEQSASTQRQEKACRKLAGERGWEVVEVHVDDDVSAYKPRSRPGYSALLASIEAGAVDAVVTWAADRLHRRPVELESFVELIERTGVEVATVQSGPVDLSSAAGRMNARIAVVIAVGESEHRSARTRSAHEQIAAEGRWKGGRRPYGYVPQSDGSMVVDEDEAEVIREAAARVLAGERVGSIVNELNRRGVPTVTGAPWRTATLRRIVSSRTVAGRRVRRGSDVGEAKWPPILSVEEVAEVTAVLDRGAKRGRVARVSLLAGNRLRCAECGESMRTARRSTGRRVYRCLACFQQVAADPLDESIGEAVVRRLDRADIPRPPKKAKKSEDPDRIAADLVALAEDWGSGRMSRAEYLAAREPLEARVANARAERDRAAGSLALVGLVGKGRASAAWATADLDRRQSIVDAMVAWVEVERSTRRGPGLDWDRVHIEWRA